MTLNYEKEIRQKELRKTQWKVAADLDELIEALRPELLRYGEEEADEGALSVLALQRRDLVPAVQHLNSSPIMDQLTIKTPKPKCRLCRCLIEFIDWRYSQLCWIFDPCCELAPL